MASAVCAIGLPVSSAGAHVIVQSDAKHYETQISNLRPAVAGLTATVDPRGDWIEVTNATDRTLVILGYAREPYLRIDAKGVQQNSHSVSAEINQPIVAELDPAVLRQSSPPVWVSVAKGNRAIWHDLRLHWGSTQRPDGVSAHPDQAQLISRWTIRMRLGTEPVQVNGTLRWLPITGKSALATIGAVLLVIVLPLAAAIGWYLVRRRIRSAPGASLERDRTGPT